MPANKDIIDKCAELHARVIRYPAQFFRQPTLRAALERRTVAVLHNVTSPRATTGFCDSLRDLRDSAASCLDPAHPGHDEFGRLAGELLQLANCH